MRVPRWYGGGLWVISSRFTDDEIGQLAARLAPAIAEHVPRLLSEARTAPFAAHRAPTVTALTQSRALAELDRLGLLSTRRPR